MATSIDSRCVVLSAESKFAQSLAGNEKTKRDRATRKLQKWMKAKSSLAKGFTAEELTKIWKGLHYCMWMSDKPLIQEELADTIARLIHCFDNAPKTGMLFHTICLRTLAREWGSIDRWRLNKYMMLVRRCLHETLNFLKNHNWDNSLLSSFSKSLYNELMSPDVQNAFVESLKLHYVDIYISELNLVAGSQIQCEVFVKLIQPFCKVLLHCQSESLLHHVQDNIFHAILDQTISMPSDQINDPKDPKFNPHDFRLSIDFSRLVDHLHQNLTTQASAVKGRRVTYHIIARYKSYIAGKYKPEKVGPKPRPKPLLTDDLFETALKKLEKQEKKLMHFTNVKKASRTDKSLNFAPVSQDEMDDKHAPKIFELADATKSQKKIDKHGKSTKIRGNKFKIKEIKETSDDMEIHLERDDETKQLQCRKAKRKLLAGDTGAYDVSSSSKRFKINKDSLADVDGRKTAKIKAKDGGNDRLKVIEKLRQQSRIHRRKEKIEKKSVSENFRSAGRLITSSGSFSVVFVDDPQCDNGKNCGGSASQTAKDEAQSNVVLSELGDAEDYDKGKLNSGNSFDTSMPTSDDVHDKMIPSESDGFGNIMSSDSANFDKLKPFKVDGSTDFDMQVLSDVNVDCENNHSKSEGIVCSTDGVANIGAGIQIPDVKTGAAPDLEITKVSVGGDSVHSTNVSVTSDDVGSSESTISINISNIEMCNLVSSSVIIADESGSDICSDKGKLEKGLGNDIDSDRRKHEEDVVSVNTGKKTKCAIIFEEDTATDDNDSTQTSNEDTKITAKADSLKNSRKYSKTDKRIKKLKKDKIVNKSIGKQKDVINGKGGKICDMDIENMETSISGKKDKSIESFVNVDDNNVDDSSVNIFVTSTPIVCKDKDMDSDDQISLNDSQVTGKVNQLDINTGSRQSFGKFVSEKTPTALVYRTRSRAGTQKMKSPPKAVMTPNASSKRVSFGMHKNTSLNFDDSIHFSPGLPYNPKVKPDQGILKPSPIPRRSPRRSLRRLSAADFF